MAKEKKQRGRPTKYRDEYCDLLVEHMRKGFSYESFAAKIQVHRSVLYDWEKVSPEWLEAKRIAIDVNLLFWEQQGIDGLYNSTEYEDGKIVSSKSLNATVWIFNMKNRHGWRDKQPEENDQININLSLADKMAKARQRASKK